MNKSNNLIDIKNLSFAYGLPDDTEGEFASHQALSDISLSIQKGEIVIIIGASGCGKTTLCRCLMGIIPQVVKGKISGAIVLNNNGITDIKEVKLAEISEYMGIVMQEPDHQIVMSTVEDDIAFGPENMMWEPKKIREGVNEISNQVHLENKITVSPAKMSGGEKQRLAIGGTLIMDSQVLIFDEPMSNLDYEEKKSFIEHIKELKNAGKTIIIVEHDYEEMRFADKWILMKNGRIIFDGNPGNVDEKILEYELWR